MHFPKIILKKDKYEIKNIFKLLKNYLENNLNYLKKNKIKINFIGEINKLPNNISRILIASSNELSRSKKKLL